MIRVWFQIEDGPVVDFYDRYGAIYIKSDKRMEAPIKKRDATSYADMPGENSDGRTVQDAFDYVVTLIFECPNKDLINANSKISALNKALYSTNGTNGVRRYKKVTFYNLLDRIKITGIPYPIETPEELYRRQDGRVMDCARVDFKIRVTDPTLCDFDLFLGSGNNLLKGTLDWTGPWIMHPTTWLQERFKDFTVAYLNNTSTDSNSYLDVAQQQFHFEPGKVYTLSFWASGSRVRTHCFPNLGSTILATNGESKSGTTSNDTYNNYSLTANYKRYYVTFRTAENLDSSVDRWVLFRLPAGKSANIAGVKLEYGEVMTGWDASPDDCEGIS